MKNVLVSVQAIVMAVLLIVLVFLPLLVVKGILIKMRVFPKMPENKPKWIGVMANRMNDFYQKYLSF